MKIVIAVLALTPTFAHAVTYDNAYYPMPNPPCVVDDCIPKNPRPCPLPRPWDCGSTGYDALGDLRSKTSGLSAAIADGKMDKAGDSLNGLFAGAGSKEKGSETSAVAAGGWTFEPRTDAGLSNFQPAPSKSGKLPLVERLDGNRERDFKIVPVGLKEEAAKEIIKEVVKEAIPVVKEAVKKADQALSDRLTAPDTERARQEFGGCRMKGTCSK